MSPRGAPDHTILVEQSFAHYTDKIIRRAAANIASSPDWTEALNVDITGVWGYMWVWANSFDFQLRIKIDDAIVFLMTINELKGGGYWGYSQSWDKFGVTVFSNVAGDKSFGMFYDEKWGLYIHKNITIETRWQAGMGTLASWGIYYKELT